MLLPSAKIQSQHISRDDTCYPNQQISRLVARWDKLLLVLASTVILGFRSHRDLWSRFLFFPRHVPGLDVGPSLQPGEKSIFLFTRNVCWTVHSALTAKMLLAPASIMILGSKYQDTYDHILLSDGTPTLAQWISQELINMVTGLDTVKYWMCQ
jgi:hypothetical protein